ncbi:MAG: C25 family cysteine peptidase [Anaerolineales bacterium]
MYRFMRSFPLALFILTSLIVSPPINEWGMQKAPAPANTNVFSFYDHCCQATWYSGGPQQQEEELPCPGDKADNRGFVIPLGPNYTLENDQPAQKSFETHPRWMTDGYIYGAFRLADFGIDIQKGDRFVAKVGFLKGAAAGEVRFSLLYDVYPGKSEIKTKLAEVVDRHDGKLRTINVDLSKYAGYDGILYLYADAHGSSGQDWAVWVDPHIERQPTATPEPTPTQPPPTKTPTQTPIPSPTETVTPPPPPTTEPTPLDETPPTFISGPAADQQTQDSTRICWTTDEPTTGRVRYDFQAGTPGFSLEDEALVKEHCLTLTNLRSATPYQYVVQALDPAGNSVTSRQLHFLTAPLGDDESPSMELLAPDTLSGKAQLKVDAVDNIGVDRVIFLIDDTPHWTDFSSPFEWHLDTTLLDEGDHDITVQVIDNSGNVRELKRLIPIENRLAVELSPVQVTIQNPSSREEVSGVVEIRAHITHENNLQINKAILKINEEEVRHLRYFNPFSEDTPPDIPPESDGDMTLRYLWDTREYDEGETIVLEVQAWDRFDNAGHAGIQVTKGEVPQPTFGIERNVTNEGHYFHVDLTVRNIGSSEMQDAHNVLIEDISKDYQSARGMIQSSYSYEYSAVTVSQFYEVIPAGDSVTISYDLVPVLLDPMDNDYTIGRTTRITFRDAEDHENSLEFTDPYIPGDYTSYPLPLLPEEIGEAFKSVKFITITDPERLFHYYDDDANALLSTLASFAINKHAVLGYRRPGEEWNSGRTLKDNIGYTGMGYSGDWANRMDESFFHGGYVLLVGETNILPSFDISGFHVKMGDTVYTSVRDTDYPYTDIWNEDGWPELRVGRILGRNPRELIEALHASVGVELGRKSFDRSHALLVSGHEDTWEGFIDRANMIAANMESHGIEVDFVHTEYYTTLTQLLREALVIRGDYECTGIPGHEIDGTPCPKTHPPTALSDLEALISKSEAEQVEEDRRGIPGVYHTSYSSECEAANASSSLIKAGAVDVDLIYWGGHGNPSSWGWALDNFVSGECGSATEMYLGGPDEPGITPLNFRRSSPVIFASSCLTGNYRGDNAISRAMLTRQAAVYIGATEKSPSGHLIGKEFFEKFLDGSPTVGEALTLVKRELVRTTETWRFVCYEYNLYGDPTFGGR